MKPFHYFWPQFFNTTCIERIGVNKLSELTCFANLLEIFTFSLLFPGKKTFPTTFGYPERNVLAFSRFMLRQSLCRSIVTLSYGTKLEFYFFSRFTCQKNQVLLFFKIRASFFVNISLSCLFFGYQTVKRCQSTIINVLKCQNINSFYLSLCCRTKHIFRGRKFSARFSLLIFRQENFVLYETFPLFLAIVR